MKNIFLTFSISLSCLSAFGQLAFSPGQIRLLDSIATQDVPPNAPGIATAIVQDGQVIYQKYAGYSNLVDSVLISKDTRFNIASNGKQFTALAILNLIDDKKLKLTDDIRGFFPALFPGIGKKITIQNLLNHTSGIRDCYALWSLQGYTWWEQSFNNNDVLKLVQEQEELNFSPGTGYSYSNTNYILLALVVEKLSGKTFVEYTDEMFRKLNMPNTSFESDYSIIRGQIAKAYFNFSTWTTFDWIWNVCGDGNIFSTLEDQIQWEKLVQGNGRSSVKKRVISKSQQIIGGSEFKNYGYGIEFGEYKGMDYTFHEGATGAWKATVVRFPGKKLSMITLTNTGKSIPSMQTRQMADVVLGTKEDAAYLVTEPSAVGEFVSDDEVLGTYLTESDFAFTFEKREGQVFLKRIGRNDVELERESDNVFHQKYDPAFKQEFARNDKGEMQVTAYYTSHSPYTLTKSNASGNDFDYKSLNGAFFNAETNTTIRVEHIDGANYEIIFQGDYKTNGILVADAKMLVDFYSLEFEDAQLFLNGDRIRRVRYERK